MYAQLNHLAVHLKKAGHCKPTILKLKKKISKYCVILEECELNVSKSFLNHIPKTSTCHSWHFIETLRFSPRVTVAQSCLTLCNAMDCSLPGSSVHGIFSLILHNFECFLNSGGRKMNQFYQ